MLKCSEITVWVYIKCSLDQINHCWSALEKALQCTYKRVGYIHWLFCLPNCNKFGTFFAAWAGCQPKAHYAHHPALCTSSKGQEILEEFFLVFKYSKRPKFLSHPLFAVQFYLQYNSIETRKYWRLWILS